MKMRKLLFGHGIAGGRPPYSPARASGPGPLHLVHIADRDGGERRRHAVDEPAREWCAIAQSSCREQPEPFILATVLFSTKQWRSNMSVKGQIKEAAGYVKEEAYEHGTSPEDKAKAQEGRNLRNEGRIEDGKKPMTTEPGTTDKHDNKA